VSVQTAMTQTRLIEVDDAAELSEALNANRSFLAPWEPEYPPDFLTPDGQRIMIAAALRAHDAGEMVPHVVTLDGQIIGRITLSNIVRSALQSGSLGYWIAEAHNGRGHATAAVGRMCAVAFDELGLHRVEAGTLLHNGGSQRVLERNGFSRYGLAPRYLRIGGEWQDHVLFQRLHPFE
jgi:ribosomal-protein-alanine N-acetyltransferase